MKFKATTMRSIDEQRRRLYDLDLRKNKRGRCAVRYCRGVKPKTKRICHKCNKRRLKINNPVAYTYNTTKQNAKRRGKVFSLSLGYFQELCLETGYLENKGRTSTAMSLDRINPTFGYIEGNVRVIAYGVNSGRSQDDIDHDPTNACPF